MPYYELAFSVVNDIFCRMRFRIWWLIFFVIFTVLQSWHDVQNEPGWLVT